MATESAASHSVLSGVLFRLMLVPPSLLLRVMLFGLQYRLFSTLLSHDGLFTHRLDEVRECIAMHCDAVRCSAVEVDPQCG